MTAVGAAVGAAVASAASPRAAFAVAGAIVLVSAVAARLMAADEDAAAVGTLSAPCRTRSPLRGSRSGTAGYSRSTA